MAALGGEDALGPEDHHQDQDEAEDHPLVLGGLELGGQVGQAVAEDHRARVAQLVEPEREALRTWRFSTVTTVAPRMAPGIEPMPPRMTMARTPIDSRKVKDSGLMKTCLAAKTRPSRPRTRPRRRRRGASCAPAARPWPGRPSRPRGSPPRPARCASPPAAGSRGSPRRRSGDSQEDRYEHSA